MHIPVYCKCISKYITGFPVDNVQKIYRNRLSWLQLQFGFDYWKNMRITEMARRGVRRVACSIMEELQESWLQQHSSQYTPFSQNMSVLTNTPPSIYTPFFFPAHTVLLDIPRLTLLLVLYTPFSYNTTYNTNTPSSTHLSCRIL